MAAAVARLRSTAACTGGHHRVLRALAEGIKLPPWENPPLELAVAEPPKRAPAPWVPHGARARRRSWRVANLPIGSYPARVHLSVPRRAERVPAAGTLRDGCARHSLWDHGGLGGCGSRTSSCVWAEKTEFARWPFLLRHLRRFCPELLLDLAELAPLSGSGLPRRAGDPVSVACHASDNRPVAGDATGCCDHRMHSSRHSVADLSACLSINVNWPLRMGVSALPVLDLKKDATRAMRSPPDGAGADPDRRLDFCRRCSTSDPIGRRV